MIDKEIEWWRKRQQLVDKKLKPKTFWDKLFYSEDSPLKKKLHESIFQLGFSIGRNYELNNHKFPKQMKFPKHNIKGEIK